MTVQRAPDTPPRPTWLGPEPMEKHADVVAPGEADPPRAASPVAAALDVLWDEHTRSRDEDEPQDDELPGGEAYAEAWTDLEREGSRQWRTSTDEERIRAATNVAIGRRRRSEGSDDWPAAPTSAAYHGVAGDLVGAVAEHTEADPVAILGTLLAMFGALAGNRRTFYLGSQQAANVFVVLVGDSSRGRKGTAFSIGRDMIGAAWPDWERILVPGLGSGEGLIGHLKRAAARDQPDHRALVLETEMARLLGVMKREGSTLSPTLRDAWDGVPLGRFLAREDSLVTNHNVGCLAHVTPAELRDKLTDTDAANGFGNRFLWLAVRRTRLVPFPGSPGPLIAPHVEALHRAIAEAQAPGELVFTPAAAARWEQLYAELADRPRYGLVGALTARAEAQVARLALVYALLDRSLVVDVDHLAAGEALWDYADRSTRFLFGDSTGDVVADYIRAHLADGPATREELRQATGVREATRLAAAIQLLVGLGLATVAKGQAGPRGGRRPDVVELVRFPSFPALPRRARAHANGAPTPVGIVDNRSIRDLRTRARAGMEESQATQETQVVVVDDVAAPVIRCDDYQGHQLEHRRVGDRFVCGRCEPEEPEDADEPRLSDWVRDAWPDPPEAIA